MKLTQNHFALILADDMVGVTELAREMGMRRESIHKRLRALEIDPTMKPFGLGFKAFVTAAQARLIRETPRRRWSRNGARRKRKSRST